jgi:hypothetical protein
VTRVPRPRGGLSFADLTATLAAIREVTASLRPPRPARGMPRKALQAAALLGDRQAAKELQRMSDNLRTVLLVTITSAAAVAIGFFMWQGLSASAAEDNALARDRLIKASELRRSYVERCRMTPDQAEGAFPEAPAKR